MKFVLALLIASSFATDPHRTPHAGHPAPRGGSHQTPPGGTAAHATPREGHYTAVELRRLSEAILAHDRLSGVNVTKIVLAPAKANEVRVSVYREGGPSIALGPAELREIIARHGLPGVPPARLVHTIYAAGENSPIERPFTNRLTTLILQEAVRQYGSGYPGLTGPALRFLERPELIRSVRFEAGHGGPALHVEHAYFHTGPLVFGDPEFLRQVHATVGTSGTVADLARQHPTLLLREHRLEASDVVNSAEVRADFFARLYRARAASEPYFHFTIDKSTGLPTRDSGSPRDRTTVTLRMSDMSLVNRDAVELGRGRFEVMELFIRSLR